MSIATRQYVQEGKPGRVVELVEALSILSQDLLEVRTLAGFSMGIALAGAPELRSNYWNDLEAIESPQDYRRLDAVLAKWEAAYSDVGSTLRVVFEDRLTRLEDSVRVGVDYDGQAAEAYLEFAAYEEELNVILGLDAVQAQTLLSDRADFDDGVESLRTTLNSYLKYSMNLLITLRTARFAIAHFLSESSGARLPKAPLPKTLYGGTFEMAKVDGKTVARYRDSSGDVQREIGPRP